MRCGQCDEVFDANAHLRSLEAPGQPQAAQQDAHVPQEPQEPQYQHYLQEPTPALDLPTAADPALISPPDDPWDWSVVHTAAADEVSLHHLHTLPPSALGDTLQHADAPEPSLEVAPPAAVEPEPAAHTVDVEPALEAPDPVPSFLAPAASPAPAPRWLGSIALAGLCAVLAALLAGQGLWQQRDLLAATAPALRPLLQAGCELLACSLSPLRAIEAIAIDSSAFTSVRPGVYLLKVTLKNTGLLELATPALELTLTDSQDQPVLRRVLLAAELGKPSLAAAAELAASLPMVVQAGELSENIAGYKLLAFYP